MVTLANDNFFFHYLRYHLESVHNFQTLPFYLHFFFWGGGGEGGAIPDQSAPNKFLSAPLLMQRVSPECTKRKAELFSYANAFFCSNKFAKMLAT